MPAFIFEFDVKAINCQFLNLQQYGKSGLPSQMLCSNLQKFVVGPLFILCNSDPMNTFKQKIPVNTIEGFLNNIEPGVSSFAVNPIISYTKWNK